MLTKVYFPVIPNRFPMTKSKIEAYIDDKLVYSGGETVEIASFEIEKPTSIKIKIQRFKDKEFIYNIEPGKSYQLVVKHASHTLTGLDISLDEMLGV